MNLIKRTGEIGAMTQIETLTMVTDPTISDVLDGEGCGSGPYLVVLPTLIGNVTNTTIVVSVAVVDYNGVESWSAPQHLSTRTLPGGGIVCERGTFEVYRSQRFKVAMESTITGGGTVTVYLAPAVL